MEEENLTIYASLENTWDWNISDFWKGEWWGDSSGRENLHRISFCSFGSRNNETVLSIQKRISACDSFCCCCLFFFFKGKELKGGGFRWSGSSFIIRGRCLGNWRQVGVPLCCLHGCIDMAAALCQAGSPGRHLVGKHLPEGNRHRGYVFFG